MAKVTITGNAAVITSEVKLEDLKTVAKYRPDSLILKGGEDGKTPIFAIATSKGAGNITEFGAAFGGVSRDDKGLATITMMLDESVTDAKAWIADHFGGALVNIGKIEKQLPGVITEINTEKAAVMESITLA